MHILPQEIHAGASGGAPQVRRSMETQYCSLLTLNPAKRPALLVWHAYMHLDMVLVSSWLTVCTKQEAWPLAQVLLRPKCKEERSTGKAAEEARAL